MESHKALFGKTIPVSAAKIYAKPLFCRILLLCSRVRIQVNPSCRFALATENHFLRNGCPLGLRVWILPMEIKLDRRTFLAVLGAATAASTMQWKRPAPGAEPATPGGIFFFAKNRNEPPARPRTAAITYLPS